MQEQRKSFLDFRGGVVEEKADNLNINEGDCVSSEAEETVKERNVTNEHDQISACCCNKEKFYTVFCVLLGKTHSTVSFFTIVINNRDDYKASVLHMFPNVF
jgi:hypothetical protein